MTFHYADADVFVPDGTPMPEALARTTHLAVGAHQDDQEFMAFEGIAECFGRPDRWFTGVCVTNGSGSSRAGAYAAYTDQEMMNVRRAEQRKAAVVGEYACEIQLMHPSARVKNPSERAVVEDLRRIFETARAEVVYLHNPADKHDTHVAVMLRAIAALRALPRELRPAKVYGSEIWRSLDWLNDGDKQVMKVDLSDHLAAALAGVYDSQISGGKRYDRAVLGRWATNATMFESHAVDSAKAMSWALDLTPLVRDDTLSVAAYTQEFIDRFRKDVTDRIARFA
jgi:LmbE family N-acetylglucosaminyl deacetylase